MHSNCSFSLTRRLLVVIGLAIVLALLAIPGGQALAQEGDGEKTPDDCAGCHAEEYGVWEESQHAAALNDPEFIEAWNRAGSPNYCKSCHASGYDAVSGTVNYEGVGCTACHTDSEGEHPASDMTVDSSPELCGQCHTGTHAPDYDQWLVSDHATMNIGCADCHQSHNTTLHLENPTELCTSCHQNLDEDMHGESGMSCHDCHMADGDQVVDPLSGQTNGAGHTFGIPSNVCADCHGMTHTLDEEASLATPGEEVDAEIEELEEAAREQANQQLNLGLTGGGIGGLIIGIAVPWLLSRSRGGKDEHAS